MSKQAVGYAYLSEAQDVVSEPVTDWLGRLPGLFFD